jgi:hypothetical protein
VGQKVRSSLSLTLVAGLAIGVSVVNAPASGAAITKDRAQVQFIQDEFVQYNAVGAFVVGLEKLSNSATKAQVRAVAKPLGLSIEAFQKRILKQSWPKNALAQVQAMSTASTQTGSALVDVVTTVDSLKTGAVNDINGWIAQVNGMNHDLGLPPFKNLQYVDSCQVDGAIVTTAMAAFHAETHGARPTIPLLTGKKDGGPYLKNWPHNKPHYTYTLTASGVLMLAAPSSATPVRYRGPSTCYPSFE